MGELAVFASGSAEDADDASGAASFALAGFGVASLVVLATSGALACEARTAGEMISVVSEVCLDKGPGRARGAPSSSTPSNHTFLPLFLASFFF